ncbi:ABC transporter ATP-binding protein [Paenibacillus baekrokdamisoli]|uniref:ABC transporter ATP-binding protein n=1 Tax=Paenibacillus baekrokdamisoli TaxID=1712516 RepID=A0A3G9J0K0_9BACL|nr:ATP-binding cassette domain-containing protein [Paenibacillus baekrokdamisoli]MBB3071274.1 ABC-2 type transport system ATP-binding protein [Paenibacillus baekrokdamisoli]BBH24690.1 ABC transporter ATP-binding protein [Paenibacillus baekrokdamisoli]
MIECIDVVKEYTIIKKKSGLSGSIQSLFRPEKKLVRGVDGISFRIEPGEIVGYLGPNGAGKSTTIKMLTGILHPTSGTVKVAGHSPQVNRKAVVRQLGVVFGQRTQLYWDLRLGETFELLKRIYRIDTDTFDTNIRLMNEVLGIDRIINTPVRQLSLGERMRGDLAAAMLHSPSILFLDEPTIGLDVEAKQNIRDFIREMNRTRGTTIILTTHDLDDVEQLCNRLIVINHGKVVEDGPLSELILRMAPYRLLVLELSHMPNEAALYHPAAELIKREGHKLTYRFHKSKLSASELIGALSTQLPVIDLSVKEPDIEDMIREMYRSSVPV